MEPVTDRVAAAPRWGQGSARVQLAAAAVAGVLLLAGVVLDWALGLWTGRPLVWASLAIGMVYGVLAAWEAVREFKADIDVLMVLGAALAAWVGHPAEGALLLFLFTLSGALEDLAMDRTKREIEALHRLMPREATVLRAGEWVPAPPEDLAVGERIRIRPGDLVPVDAKVVEGRSSIDQSTLTGESMPRAVRAGDALFAGTVNIYAPLEAAVSRPASESSLQKVLKLVMVAREQREPMQQLIDRLGGPYASTVMLVSLAVLLVWWLGFRVPLADSAITAITFLIVLSPCALIIATPTTTLAAIARGARAGVLFKGGQAIERLSRANAVCFDKTGTLTFGRPSLSQIEAVGWSNADRLLAVAAGLETHSTHPIAKAVREGAENAGVAPATVTGTRHDPGQGIIGEHDGETVAIGLYPYVEEVIPVCLRARTRELLDRTHKDGQLSAVIAAGGEQGATAVFVISDPIRPGARGLVRRMHELGVRPVRMLTGDNAITAERVARDLGLDAFDAELLPEDKVRLVREMRAAGARVAFIGDGVNDAPALAAADVAIAIGSIGSDAALESADIVLLNDDLETVPWALRLARRARAILKFNIALAMGVIVVMGVFSLVGSRTGLPVPMWLGVTAHEGGTLLVVLNALRLLWARGVEREGDEGPAAG